MYNKQLCSYIKSILARACAQWAQCVQCSARASPRDLSFYHHQCSLFFLFSLSGLLFLFRLGLIGVCMYFWCLLISVNFLMFIKGRASICEAKEIEFLGTKGVWAFVVWGLSCSWFTLTQSWALHTCVCADSRMIPPKYLRYKFCFSWSGMLIAAASPCSLFKFLYGVHFPALVTK